MSIPWKIENPQGQWRIIVTRELPGNTWRNRLVDAGCRVEIYAGQKALTKTDLIVSMGTQCDGVIGQLAESWDADLFSALADAGGQVYSNYAVGYNNVDLDAATRFQISVGNTPDLLTHATAELAAALTVATARRMGEAERYLRDGKFDDGWHPTLLLGRQLYGKTVGVVGAGRIGEAYARKMLAGFHMNLCYYSRRENSRLDAMVGAFNHFAANQSLPPARCHRARGLEELLKRSDYVSLHLPLTDQTLHLIGQKQLAQMKPNAVLVNTSRGPIIDEAALVKHLQENGEFRAGLDVFEKEPELAPGLADLENVLLVPHIGSATRYARNGMAVLAAANIVGILKGYPIWNSGDMTAFLAPKPPQQTPSIVTSHPKFS